VYSLFLIGIGLLASDGIATAQGLNAAINVAADQVVRKIPRTLYGTNVQWVWNGNGLWLDQTHSVDPTLLGQTQALGVSLIRYPGGLYADFYHWRDGIGPYDQRPMALHEPTSGDHSRPNFGTDEALQFAAQVGGQLLIEVNVGTGTPQEAADWVRYVNANQLRVVYWELGNELYINDGSPSSKAITMDPATYATKFLQFAQAMRAVDPRIKIGAIGGRNRGLYAINSYPNWDQIVLQNAGSQIDFLSVHNAYAPGAAPQYDLRTVYQSMLAAPLQIAQDLRALANEVATYAPARASQIGIAVTEWGPLFQMDTSGIYVEHTKTLTCALLAASTLKALVESPATQMANFHVLNDFSIMGWIGLEHGQYPQWTPTARYYAFQLFSKAFGEDLVTSRLASPTYNSIALGGVDAAKNVPYLEVVSSLNADHTKLQIMVINKHFDQAINGNFTIQGFAPRPNGTAYTLTGTGLDANTGTDPIPLPGVTWAQQITDPVNPRFYAGGPGEVSLITSSPTGMGKSFAYKFPPHSVTLLVLSR